ncbi:hypothetical protein FXO37_22687 [Capsicum annuum]|nr:hypothetical protein FXO37_22687 [Capsicum annuum]
MEPNSPVRFKLGKQSSLAPEREVLGGEREDGEDGVDIDPRVRLMYSANEGDIEGIKEILECGTDVNFRDIDKRTALHVAACHGSSDVVQLLLDNGAEGDPKDRWGSTLSLWQAILWDAKPSPLRKRSIVLVFSPRQGSWQAILWDEKPSALNRKNSPSGASSGIRLRIIDPRIVANTSTFRPSLGHYYGYPEILDGASWQTKILNIAMFSCSCIYNTRSAYVGAFVTCFGEVHGHVSIHVTTRIGALAVTSISNHEGPDALLCLLYGVAGPLIRALDPGRKGGQYKCTGGIAYNSVIPRAIWDLPLPRQPSPQPKFVARVGISALYATGH